jgi:hypothetical protein
MSYYFQSNLSYWYPKHIPACVYYIKNMWQKHHAY